MVDTFVAVESNLTHSGVEKGWRLGEHRDRLAAWWDKLVWVTVQGVAGEPSWVAENRQRRACQTAAGGLEPAPGDVVVVSDVDEVWDGRALEAWQRDMFVARQDFRLFSALWRWPELWAGSIGGPWSKMSGHDFQSLRDARQSLPGVESGWHFSWMGDLEAMRRKQAAYAHREYADVPLERFVAEGRWFDGTMLIETDGNLPEVPSAWLRTRAATI